jgi:hypothetical protein
MWLPFARRFALSAVVVTNVMGSTAVAQPALDDSTPAPPATTDGEPGETETPVEYGVGLRLRGVFVPKGEIELFVERAGDNGSNQLGYGIELTRRRGNVELQLGIEYDPFNPGAGVWIDKGNDVANGDPADVVLARGDQPKPLGWLTFDFTFINHAPLTKNIAIRYGGGLGIGIVLGELQHYDVFCAPGATNESTSPGCEPPVPPFNGTAMFESAEMLVKYDLPPVFPVVNAILGVQLKPTDALTINIEGGIRTFLFFGISSSYFF